MKPVLQVFAAMLIHGTFREDMKANPEAALINKGYTLNQSEMQVMLRIVDSFKNGQMNDAIGNVMVACPNWPCDDGSLAA